MTTALGIAGVTAVIRNLLTDGLIDNDVGDALGTSVAVSTGPPDRVAAVNGSEATQLNLFLHRVTPNTGWINERLPSVDDHGRRRLTNPPLALNLHYLISAYSGDDLHGEILLGYAMQLLHEMPVIPRDLIRTALMSEPVPTAPIPPALRALAAAGLENQLEQIKITPEYLNTEEMSKLWAATMSHLRPTAAYVATVVLIQSERPASSPLPVLSRGPVDLTTGRDRGVLVAPHLVPAVPTLDAIAPAGDQPSARLGQPVDLTGHHLDGAGRTVLLANDRFSIEESLPANPGTPNSMPFTIPVDRAADFPVGVYRVGARLVPPDEIDPRETNRLGMLLAPDVTGLPMTVNLVGNTANFTLNFVPAVRLGQSVSLVLGDREFAPEPFTPPTQSLDFEILNAPTGAHLCRLRIDGIDSPIIDRAAKPPTFLGRRITIQ